MLRVLSFLYKTSIHVVLFIFFCFISIKMMLLHEKSENLQPIISSVSGNSILCQYIEVKY